MDYYPKDKDKCMDYISGDRDMKCSHPQYQGDANSLWVDQPLYNKIAKQYSNKLDPNINFGKPDPEKIVSDPCMPTIEHFGTLNNSSVSIFTLILALYTYFCLSMGKNEEAKIGSLLLVFVMILNLFKRHSI